MRRRTKWMAGAASTLLLIPTAVPSAPSAEAHPLLPSPPSSRPVLSLGDQGEEVKVVQRSVGATVDGRFGPKTRQSVQSFQSASGLVADGIVGPLTWAALDQSRTGVAVVSASASASGGSVSGRPELSLGATGSAVTELQTLLTRAGQSTAADGTFGPATHASVIAFQRSRGLTPDGVVGSRTWAALGGAAPASSALTLAAQSQPWQIIGSRSYVVKTGDTWTSIAAATQSTATALSTANRSAVTARPAVGRTIQVPGAWRCPVAGGSFINDYGFPRGADRVHLGNDLFAPRGTPVRAPVAGRVETYPNSIGGNAIQLHGNDGHRYYFAHLDRYGLQGQVEADAVIGYVGNTGNAITTPPHLHFEVHPGGGAAINPFPTLTLACRR